MEKIKRFFTKYIFPASFVFTLFTFAMLYFSSGANAENGEKNITSLKILLFAFAYFIYIFVTAKVYSTTLQPFFKAVIHYILSAVPLIVFLVYISNKQSSNDGSFQASTIVIMMIAYTIIYALVAIITSAFNRNNGKSSDKAAEDRYKSQFGRM